MIAAEVAGIVRDWTYAPSKRSAVTRFSQMKAVVMGRRRPPPSRALRAITPRRRWNMLFLYTPDGMLRAHQLFTIAALRRLEGGLMVVCAAPSAEAIPAEIASMVDALYWKGLGGFDFSAYALAIDAVARHSRGADLYCQNDSVLGPFVDIDTLLSGADWRLTGVMGSAAVENHVQSYAFMLRGVDPALRHALRRAVSTRWACNHWGDVVKAQETRMARIAARSMSVGALWFATDADDPGFGIAAAVARKLRGGRGAQVLDPSLVSASGLLDQGFPFLKKSLFGKNRNFADRAALDAFLAAQGHPRMDEAA